MVAPSNYNIEVESILGGLESALARGQPLKKAMSSFRNAGYKEENIKEAAKKFQELHRMKFYDLGVNLNKPQKKIVGGISQPDSKKEDAEKGKLDVQEPKALVPVKTRERLIEQYEREKLEIEDKKPHSQKRIQGAIADTQEQIDRDLKFEEAQLQKKAGEAPTPIGGERVPSKKFKKLKKGRDKDLREPGGPRSSGRERKSSGREKKPQVVSGYGDEALRASENFREAINEMVQSLSKIPLNQQAPSSGRGKQKPQVINKISNYGMKPPTPVNKAVTFLLIFLLILLLGVLAAVFFFREELIDLFNTFTFDYLLPLL